MFCALSRALAQISTARSTSCGWSSAHCSACIPPSEPPIAACSRSTPSSREQRAVDAHEVADAEEREVEAVGLAGLRVDRRRPGRPAAAAEQVRADDEEALGVDRLAGADQRVPPHRRLRVAGQRVADEDRRRARVAVGLVGHLDRREPRPGFEDDLAQSRVRFDEITPVSKPARCSPPWKRACSIFTQRLVTTSSSASCAIRTASSECSPSWIHSAPAPASIACSATSGQVVGLAEDVDDVGLARQVGERRVGLAGRGSRRRWA